jgi:hypothetical protein
VVTTNLNLGELDTLKELLHIPLLVREEERWKFGIFILIRWKPHQRLEFGHIFSVEINPVGLDWKTKDFCRGTGTELVDDTSSIRI